MRKFNLKGTVVQRMRGIPREDPAETKAEKQDTQAQQDLSALFCDAQGCLKCSWRTDVGKLRKSNQDAVILGNGLAGVADGMGGHKGGEIASAGLRDGLLRETKDYAPDQEKLAEAIRKVNRELWQQQEDDPALSGMGTTLTILWPTEHDMIVGQVGDSRAYLLRDGALTQVTQDHSMVADMVRKGVLTEEQAACHPMRNYITRAVGTEETIEVDFSVHIRKTGDRWLVCSDGLHGMVAKNELLEILMTEDLEKCAETLLRAALENGGRDNISLVLLEDDTVFADTADETVQSGDIPSSESGGTEEVTVQ